MNKLVVSLVSCSGSIAAVLAASSIANTDSANTIPYPEVMNLTRVPIFNAQGMVPQPKIANSLPKKSTQPQSLAQANPAPTPTAKAKSAPITLAKAIPAPITVDLVSKTVREAAIGKYGGDCPGCRDLSPSMMVLGYSSHSANSGSVRTMY